MRIKTLVLDNFGPFRRYTIPFVDENPVCVLLTGKNNEGKSNIILALKLVAAACRSVGKVRQRSVIDNNVYYRLLQPDTDGINIGRTLHNYSGEFARITAVFEDKFDITVTLDERRNAIYADYGGRVPSDVQRILGFIPPLGPLAEEEEYLTLQHVRANIGTSLSPRHLRNYLAQILADEEYKMVQDIVRQSWPSIALLPYEHDRRDNRIRCFFREGRIDREVAWAGQGLQVWFQIITHLVRLRHTEILVLDEPEVNLHAEKQIDLVRILREHHIGSTIVATHSVELMNNVNVSHIIHVRKDRTSPTIKSTRDRTHLEVVRSHIGSNFNLIASQFDDVHAILFTEDASDFKILHELAGMLGVKKTAFNIPLHGFSEYPKAVHYRNAYRLLIGGDAKYSILLDRDYYPEEHLAKIRQELKSQGIRTHFTPGKEIENLFLSPAVLDDVIPGKLRSEFDGYWDRVCDDLRLDCFGSYLTLHCQFLPGRLDTKTVAMKYTPAFDAKWNDPRTRHLAIGGKVALQRLREFYRNKTGRNLTLRELVTAAIRSDTHDIKQLISSLYHEDGC
jgi:hypothetical protein